MSKCPFWSNSRERVECNTECPMHTISDEDKKCPFKEYISNTEFKYKDIIKGEYDYSDDGYDEDFLGMKM